MKMSSKTIGVECMIDGRVCYRIADLIKMTGFSRSWFDRMRAGGEFPQPDIHLGTVPLWHAETIAAWLSIESGKSPR